MSENEWFSYLGWLSSTATAIITFFYTRYTYQMLKTMKMQYIDVNQPKINVMVKTDISYSMFYLVIENVGSGIAENVKMRIDKDFFMFSKKLPERNIKNSPPFNGQISYMPPGDKYTYYLDQSWKLFESARDANQSPKINPVEFTISISYRYANSDYTKEYVINLENYMNTTDGPDRLIDELHGINKQLGEIVSAARVIQMKL